MRKHGGILSREVIRDVPKNNVETWINYSRHEQERTCGSGAHLVAWLKVVAGEVVRHDYILVLFFGRKLDLLMK